MPGMLEWFDPEIEVSAPDGLEYASVMMRLLGPRGVVLLDKYRGHDEVRRLYEALWTISAQFTVDAEEFVEHEGAVVVPAVLRAVTADAGTEGEVHVAHLWTLAAGKVTSLRIYVDVNVQWRRLAWETGGRRSSIGWPPLNGQGLPNGHGRVVNREPFEAPGAFAGRFSLSSCASGGPRPRACGSSMREPACLQAAHAVAGDLQAAGDVVERARVCTRSRTAASRRAARRGVASRALRGRPRRATATRPLRRAPRRRFRAIRRTGVWPSSPTGLSRLATVRAYPRTSCTCCDRHLCHGGNLVLGGRAAELGGQRPLDPRDRALALDHVHGHPDDPRAVRDSPLDGLPHPPARVGREPAALPPVELLGGADQPDDALLDQVEHRAGRVPGASSRSRPRGAGSS